MKKTVTDKTRQKNSKKAVKSTASRKEYKQSKKQDIQIEQTSSNTHGILAKVLLTIVLMLVAIVFIFVSGAFNISEIIVEGNSKISDEQIVSFSEIEKGTNLFAISKKEIIGKIKENSYVGAIRVKRCLPDKIKLVIEEREPEFALQLANSFVYMNRQGYILEISNNEPTVPIILGCITDLSNVKENHRLDETDLQKMNMVIKIMEMAKNQEIQNLITKIDISNEKNYTIYLDAERKIAYLGDGTDLNTRFLYIKAILKEQQGKAGEIFVNVDLNSEYVYFAEKNG